MNDLDLKILDLLNENKNIRQIATIVNLSEKQVYIRLKTLINYGYQIKPFYSYNSDIYYKVLNNINQNNNRINISISKNEELFRCIVISDMHIGHIKSNIRLMDSVYEYAVKNNINIIFNCGDNLEGDYTSDKKSLKDIYSQIEEFIKKYPYDRSIKNFMIFGNHDYHLLTNNGLDVSKKISSSRYDLISLGFGQGIVNLNHDNLVLFHKLSSTYKINTDYTYKIVLSGHGHMMKSKIYDKLILCVPTLSYKSTFTPEEVLPGFIDLTLYFDKGKFDYVVAKNMTLTPDIYRTSEFRCRIKRLLKNNYDK